MSVRTGDISTAWRTPPVVLALVAGIGVVLGVSLLLFPVFLVVGVLLSLVAAVLFLTYPFVGAMTFVAFYYLRPMDYIPELGVLRISLFVASVTATGLIVRLLLAKEQLVEGWYVKAFLALWAVMWLSVPLATWRGNSFAHTMSFAKYGVAMVWMVYMSIRSRKQLHFGVRMLGWMALWLAGSTVYTYYSGDTMQTAELSRAGTGNMMLGDPNDTAAVILMMFPLCYYLFFHDPKRWMRGVYALAMVLSLVAVVLTGSRGGFLGLVFLLFLLWLRSRRKVLGMFVALAVFGALWFTAPEGYRERIRSITEYHQDESAMARVHLREAAVRMFLHNPLVGIGIGNFMDFAREYGAITYHTAHNMYLLVLGELGALGITVFLYIWLRALREAKRLGEEDEDPLLRALGWGAFVGLLDMMVTGYFLSISYYPYQYFVMAMVAVAASRREAIVRSAT
ncbi:MAG: O-antigen ligase family protein [Armatimonadota bacterium]|nr:O-antigen ligase family protein [Armatimonadota bacterium]